MKSKNLFFTLQELLKYSLLIVAFLQLVLISDFAAIAHSSDSSEIIAKSHQSQKKLSQKFLHEFEIEEIEDKDTDSYIVHSFYFLLRQFKYKACDKNQCFSRVGIYSGSVRGPPKV